MKALPSLAFQAVIEQATIASRSDVPVLLTGESGTGKELLAAFIHSSSPRLTGPFVKVNCGAIPDALIETELFGHEKGSLTWASSMRRGKFELAQNGTLFFDEIGDLPANLQAKLARALQSGEFTRMGGRQAIATTARVISSTCRDLSIGQGGSSFREDLFDCVCGVSVRIPALRERPEDIQPMAEYFLEEFCARSSFSRKSFHPAVWKVFEDYSWPGNAQELRNVVERMAIRSQGDRLHVSDIPDIPAEVLRRNKPASWYTIQ